MIYLNMKNYFHVYPAMCSAACRVGNRATVSGYRKRPVERKTMKYLQNAESNKVFIALWFSALRAAFFEVLRKSMTPTEKIKKVKQRKGKCAVVASPIPFAVRTNDRLRYYALSCLSSYSTRLALFVCTVTLLSSLL